MESKIKSLERALKILELFGAEEPELGVTEISTTLGMHKSTVFNIIDTFQEHGYLKQNPKTGKYSLGLKILQLSYNMYSTFDIRKSLYPYLSEIAAKTNETVYLGMLSEDKREVVYIDALLPNERATVRNNIGIRAPLYCTAIGKAFLAYIPEEALDKALSIPLLRFTPNTIVDKNMLLEDIRNIRARGFSIDDMEHEYGIKCVGMVLVNSRKEPVCSVSISGPSPRFSQEKVESYAALLMELKKTAEKLIL